LIKSPSRSEKDEQHARACKPHVQRLRHADLGFRLNQDHHRSLETFEPSYAIANDTLPRARRIGNLPATDGTRAHEALTRSLVSYEDCDLVGPDVSPFDRVADA
jgi:hypothetical protein